MGRKCNNPMIYNDESASIQNVFTGQGVNVQTSYILPSKWVSALRNSTIYPERKIKERTGYNYYNQSTIGVTKYILGHNLKVQADASYNYKNGANINTYNRYEIRFQVELGF